MTQQNILPARVEATIAKQQYKSELLVACAQLFIVALLSILYIVAPSENTPDAPIMAAPLGLSLFAILVFLRLYFALTQQLKSWFIGLSTIAEMVVLMGTIWAYHIQFEQPAMIYLKHTALLYVFTLIALRTLRFQAIWVVFSGITAVICWLILVGYALYTAGDNSVTWDYVTYATTGQIFLRSEFDKILSIVIVTGILAVTLFRGRRILINSVSQTQATADLSLFFDTDVAKRITGDHQGVMVGQGELRHAVILFTDMRGFTIAAATMSPSELIALLGEYQHLLVPIIQQHGGNIDKFLGDGILASFGAVNPSATYAADGFKAVDAIMKAVEGWEGARKKAGLIAPGVGAGLAVGEVIFGVIGDDKRLEYTVIGDAVNLAAKLEKHNKVEQSKALSTMDALNTAINQGYKSATTEMRAQRNVSGVTVPIDLVVWI